MHPFDILVYMYLEDSLQVRGSLVPFFMHSDDYILNAKPAPITCCRNLISFISYKYYVYSFVYH